jgi:hypothetical protein
MGLPNLGLTWDSLEPWGDIPYHYGRWVELDSPGWCWVPGYDWAPAWVSWRCNDDYIGWAPLPPCVPWRTACGIGSWVDACGGLGPGSYCFLPARHFGATDCRPILCARSENSVHFGRTRNVTRLTCKPGGGPNASPILEGPAARRLAALGVKDMRYRRLNLVDGPVRISKNDASRLTR